MNASSEEALDVLTRHGVMQGGNLFCGRFAHRA